MPHILLTGAGFSHNWGGWLAKEAFEYLLGSDQVDGGIRKLLWDYKDAGGFEGALGQLQDDAARGKTDAESSLAKLENALSQMFGDMNNAFATTGFESRGSGVRNYLKMFDAIFTLNQDLLMEPHYFNSGFLREEFCLHRKWKGCQIPGMQAIPPEGLQPYKMRWVPFEDETKFVVEKDHQPYFKLHGSSNWFADDKSESRRLLIIGGNKASAIDRYPILKWNHKQFRDCLMKADTRLMVIGYSFGDAHINTVIGDAADRGTLRLFIVDPSGVDVLQREGLWLFPDPAYLGGDRLHPYVIGASRRRFRAIFEDDDVERGKLMRFFD